MQLLILGIGLLLGAPLIYSLFEKRVRLRSWVERGVGVAMVIILVTHVLPEAIHSAGTGVLFAAALGFIFIVGTEKLPGLAKYGAHHLALVLAFTGLALHTTIDGLALFMPNLHDHHGHTHGASGTSLAWAVILHRVPVGMFVWGYLKNKFSPKIAYAVLVAMSLSTLAGYMAGGQLEAIGEWESNLAWIQAFIAGSLMHIVLDPWLHAHEHPHESEHAHNHAHSQGDGAPKKSNPPAPDAAEQSPA